MINVVALALGCSPRTHDQAQQPSRTEAAQTAVREHLPEAFDAEFSDEELKVRFKITEVLTVDHPEYSSPLKVLLQESTGEFREMEFAFYELRNGKYLIIDTSQIAGGYHTPTMSKRPDTEIPALRAQMIETDDATYFFVEGGKLHSVEEHPESWLRVK